MIRDKASSVMRRRLAFSAPATVILVAALAALAQVHAEDLTDSDAMCPRGDATLHGNYMAVGGGIVVGVGSVAFVGKLTYDGKGHITKLSTVSFVGEIITSPDNPTYTVHRDCTGTHTSGDGTQHYNFVVSPDGSKLEFVESDPGTVISGTITRMNDRD